VRLFFFFVQVNYYLDFKWILSWLCKIYIFAIEIRPFRVHNFIYRFLELRYPARKSFSVWAMSSYRVLCITQWLNEQTMGFILSLWVTICNQWAILSKLSCKSNLHKWLPYSVYPVKCWVKYKSPTWWPRMWWCAACSWLWHASRGTGKHGKPEQTKKIWPQCHFVHHESHTKPPWTAPRPQRRETGF
jgi:hypothetical protein